MTCSLVPSPRQAAPSSARCTATRSSAARRSRLPPPTGAPRACNSFENQYVGEEHPQRAAENARVFVPLHGPDFVREAVAQDEPRPREVAYGVPVFRRDPRRDERDVGQCFGGFFRKLVWKSMKAIGSLSSKRAWRPGGLLGVGRTRSTRSSGRSTARTRASPSRTCPTTSGASLYDALTHSSGTNPIRSVMPVMPSHPGESRMAYRITAANLRT